MRRSHFATWFAAVGLAAGCYSPSFDNPTCPTGECPSGFTCVQGQCVAGNGDVDAPTPDTPASDATDATDIDTPMADATDATAIDAPADAPADAPTDAPIDANPCTGVTATWTRLTPATSPPARYSHSMAYDPVRQRVVLFGGRTGPNNADLLNDTWEFTGTTWNQITTATPPSPRSDTPMVFDEVAGRVMMYGGYTQGGGTQSTYTWDGVTWTLRSTTGNPSYRHDHGLAYDTAADRAILFGGFLGGVGVDGDTWEWNPSTSTWTERTPSPAPSARHRLAMAYDIARGLTVLFGGQDNQTWTWNQTTLAWTQRTSACTPPVSQPVLVNDTSSATVVLLAGTEVWQWNGTGWTRAVTNTGPASLIETGAAYSASSTRIVVFGGLSGATPLGETWTLDVQ